ncbi:MAG: cytochrome c553 [Thermoproteota archaeon]|jgi:cytochrome c553
MTAPRLIVLFCFLAVTTSFLMTQGYKKYFSAERSLSFAAFDAKEIAKFEAAKLAASAAKAPKTLKVASGKIDLTNPLLKKGHLVYTESGQCITCHGDKGQGDAEQEAPLLAGQHAWYIQEQLGYMKAGTRKNESMDGFLDELTPADFEAVAAYINLLRVK